MGDLSALSTKPGFTVGDTSASSSGGWRSNPNYRVTIYDNGNTNRGQNIVQAFIPENFHFRVQNSWEPFISSIGGGVESLIHDINTAANTVGVSINFKILSALVWQRMEPIEFQFTFLFDAIESALVDVTAPVMNLIAMATPRRDLPPNILGIQSKAFTLVSPGPTIGHPERNISMKVGRFFYIDSVVIDSLDINWHTSAEGSGDFIAADVEIALKGWYSPDQADIFSYFGLGDPSAAAYLKSDPTDFSSPNAPLIYNTTADLNNALDTFKRVADKISNGINNLKINNYGNLQADSQGNILPGG